MEGTELHPGQDMGPERKGKDRKVVHSTSPLYRASLLSAAHHHEETTLRHDFVLRVRTQTQLMHV
jgi:hypothetical protein